ncbi:MAG: transketolase [Candidatus Eisenbacteria bacterium]|nr:transketolase [Candidatus Latescibacterota bacterium]MBD3303051.1 transketolase [Candidatus Eisenbacteria bacterium]
MSFSESVHAKAIDLIRLAIDMTAEAGSGHPTSGASLAHLVTVLLFDHMRYDPAEPGRVDADRLILSEGHACPIIYAAAPDLGMKIGNGSEQRKATREEVMRLRAIDSPIDGHPNPAEGFPFFPAATGSLGQGLSVAAGLALAARMDGCRNRFFCLIGDGESREGQVWEAIDFLQDQNLRAVCPIFNCNRYGQTGEVSPMQSPEILIDKLVAAGYEVAEIDGHDPEEICSALGLHAERADGNEEEPVAIVARTIKGWGFPVAHGDGHHGKPVSGEDREKAHRELDETAKTVGARWTDGDLNLSAIPSADPPPKFATKAAPANLRDALRRFEQEAILEKGKLATRKAYGHALRALGHADARVVVLDGDVSNSTYSEIFKDDPDLRDRFFESRIAEQNMVSAAAGLATGGKHPFMSTFGKFTLRAYDQLEMALVGRANVKLVGSHCGVSLAADGPSQMGLVDAGFMRSLATAEIEPGKPLMVLLQPADAYAAYALTIAMGEYEGPCYMRTHRPDVPFLYDEDSTFRIRGHHVLAEGDSLLILAAGYMVHEAMGTLDRFRERDLNPTLVDLYSVPFDESAIADLARANGGRVLTVEDNYGGGIGSAVSDALTRLEVGCRIEQMHVRRIPKSGREPEEVMEYLGLSRGDILRTGLSMLSGSNAG